ncbi:carboxylesterase/lipase family protein [Dactylosporangium vinaceum]|uniref:Carboxylic ester hydrolase n=1 Tax=Dactylosporangium vinaceum TaxID=53362 RepID=A0ABV5LZG9_9ACTN|nr:carboxylesterase family protein [Dactylosporangium vinaceum]UAB92614.1 carboxylesterase/lipase family protein [Dactylosporangium vinaceum]
MAEVRTAAGVLRGRSEAGVTVFRGMPFAAPPVGALRFAAPAPAAPWDGVREAVAFGPPPPQPDPFGRGETRAEGAEWLTVNVWSADPGRGANLPVMVWIQGGGYTFGAASSPEFDGHRLARDGVVVVTFNYRVGFEGFAQIAGAPANRGLLDQVAALAWVRDNIGAFGGDPDRVTVFGESAGAGSIAALLVMPRADGLFRRAIAQSVPGACLAPELAAEIAAACTAELGLEATVAELADVDPALLVEAAMEAAGKMTAQARWGVVGYRSLQFGPVVDGDVLPVGLFGNGRATELLVGHNRDEQRLFSALTGVIGQVTGEQADEALRLLAPGPHGERRYREAFPDAGAERLYELVHGDWLFRMPSLHLAEAQLRRGGPAYLYELTWAAPGLGATHGLDVPLVFGNLGGSRPAMLLGGAVAAAQELSAQMRAAWTAFATTGDPGWPAYDTERRLTRVFDVEPEVVAYPEDASRRIWGEHTFDTLRLRE